MNEAQYELITVYVNAVFNTKLAIEACECHAVDERKDVDLLILNTALKWYQNELENLLSGIHPADFTELVAKYLKIGVPTGADE